MGNRILVVDDEKEIADVIELYLKNEGFEVEKFYTGKDALVSIEKAAPDMALLDVMLPKVDGFAVLELIRKESLVPVLMVTARDSVEDQVRGFHLQADDYIPKPFDMPVLLCKIAAVLRRTGRSEQKKDLVYGGLKLDEEGHHLFNEGQEVELTQKEFDLLRLFLKNSGRVFTRQNLLDQVWGEDYFGDERIVDTHIKNLRKKLGNQLIETVRGVGYRLEKIKK